MKRQWSTYFARTSLTALPLLLALSLGLNVPVFAGKPTYAKKMELGQLLYFNGNLDGAINAFLYAAALNPSAFEPHLNLVNLYVQKGTPEGIEKAIEECHEVLKLKPGNKEVHLILGNLLRTQSSSEKDTAASQAKLEEALKEIHLAQEQGAPEAMCENTLGLLLLQKGDRDAALEHIEKAVKKQPNFPDAHLIRSVLLFRKAQDANLLKDMNSVDAKKKLDEVLKELDLAIKQKEKNPEARNTKGDILFAMGKHTEALEQYQKATEDEPRYAQAWAGIGNTQAQLKDFDKAREAYRKAKEINPSDKNIIYGLAVMLEKQGEIANAVQEFQEAIMMETDPVMKAQIQLHIQQLLNQGAFNLPGLGGLNQSPTVGNGLFTSGALSQPFSSLIKIKPPSDKEK